MFKRLILLLPLCLVFVLGVRLGSNSVGKWLQNRDKSTQIFQEKKVGGEVQGITTTQEPQTSGSVKGVADEISEDSLVFRLKVNFLETIHAVSAKFDTNVEVGNDVLVGGNLDIGGTLTVGDIAITPEGIESPNLEYSILAGDGIAMTGTQDVTITNDDPGSAQNIFSTFKIGDSEIKAGSNTDLLTFLAGSGISLSANTDEKELTIATENLSGWYKPNASVVALLTSSNNVGIGTTLPTNKLEIDSGTADLSGLTFSRLTSASSSGVGGGKVLSLDSGGRVILVNDQTGDTPTAESVLPDSDTGGTLYFNGANWVSSTNLFHNGGTVGISTTSPAGRFHAYTNAVGTIGAVIQGITDQTANLQEWRNGAGSILSYIDSAGVFNGSANVAGSIDPGLVEGQVAFQGADGLAGSNNLFWDNSTGNLGVGTNSPSSKLYVNGTSYFADTMTFPGNKTISFQGHGIVSSWAIQYIGGVSSVQLNQSYDGDVFVGSASRASFAIGTQTAVGKFTVNGAETGKALAILNETGDQNIFTASSSGTTRLVVTNAGNVGIGISSPNYALATSGVTYTSSYFYTNGSWIIGNGANYGIYKSSTNAGYLGDISGTITGSTIGLVGPTSGNLGFLLRDTASSMVVRAASGQTANIQEWQNTSGTALSVVDANGNVGIGTSAPIGLLNVSGAATGKALTILNETGNQDLLVASASGVTKFKIGNTGNIDTGNIITIGGATSTAGALYFFDNGVRIERTGNSGLSFVTSGSAVGGGSTFTTEGAATSPLTVRGAVAQTAPLQEWHNSASTVLTVIDASGNFGIGTTTPTKKLELATSTSDDGFILRDSSTGNIAVNIFKNSTTDVGRIILSDSGTSTINLIASSTSWVSNSLTIGNNAALSARLGVKGAGNTSATSSLLIQNSSNTNLLDIKDDGNVGIGTTTPIAKFQTNFSNSTTTWGANGSVGAMFMNENTTANNWSIFGFATKTTSGVDRGGAYISAQFTDHTNNSVDAELVFHTQSNNSFGERLRISSSGNIGIGTASPTHSLSVVSAGTSAFRVTSTQANSDIYLDNSVGMRYQWDATGIAASATGLNLYTKAGSSQPILFKYGSTELARISSGGNLGIGTASPGQALDVLGNARFSAVGSDAYASDLHLTADGTLTTAASDVRLKKDFVELNDTQILDKLLQLKTYNFTWKSNNSNDIGMVAQEVATIFPELTFTNKVDGYMGINYSRFSSLLISGMQAQQAQILSLQNALTINTDGSVAVATASAQHTQNQQDESENSSEENAVQTTEQLLGSYVTLSENIWKFLVEVRFSALAVFENSVQFLSFVVFRNDVIVDGNLILNHNHAGTVTIPAGKAGARVSFSQAFEQPPIITITPTQKVSGEYWISTTSNSGFTIEFSQSQAQDIAINWQVSVTNSGEGIAIESFDFDTDSGPAQETSQTSQEQDSITEDVSAILGATDSGEVVAE